MPTITEIQQRILESGLLDETTLETEIADWFAAHADRTDDGQELLDRLVRAGHLSRFHADALADGHTGPFRLGAYEVHRILVASRSGAIYRARHVDFDQPVSLKVFSLPDEAGTAVVNRIGREMRVAVALDHPNVVRTFQAGKVGEIYYLALEDLAGETLAARLAREGKLPYARACEVVRDAARGLAHLHENDIEHRDIAPRSIWLGDDGSVKLMEFGAAHDALAFLDVDESVLIEEPADHDADEPVNEYDYLPAEQVYDPRLADMRSDVYALGCTFYHCLTGAPPFHDRDPVRQILRHVFEAPAPVSRISPEIPPQLDETLAGMLAKRPADRFQSARDVVWALDQYLVEREPAEEIKVVDVSPQYLAWAKQQHPAEPPGIAVGDVAATPELARFLNWMAVRTRQG